MGKKPEKKSVSQQELELYSQDAYHKAELIAKDPKARKHYARIMLRAKLARVLGGAAAGYIMGHAGHTYAKSNPDLKPLADRFSPETFSGVGAVTGAIMGRSNYDTNREKIRGNAINRSYRKMYYRNKSHLKEEALFEAQKWIQHANTSMERRGTKGKLGRLAAQHGMSTCAYARKLGRGNKMANFALNTGCKGKG
jgi:hypothetical protein